MDSLSCKRSRISGALWFIASFGVLVFILLAQLKSVVKLNSYQPASIVQKKLPPITPPSPGWLLYLDDKARYSFYYPANAHPSASRDAGFEFETVRLQFKPPAVGMAIWPFSNHDRLKPAEAIWPVYTGKKYQSPADIEAVMRPIMVAGYAAFKVPNLGILGADTILLPYDNKVYAAGAVGRMGERPSEETLQVFNQVLATVRITP